MQSVCLSKIIEKMELENLTPEINVDEIQVTSTDINRLALQLVGFFEHFPTDRVQVIGHVEHTYLSTLDIGRRKYIYDQILSTKIPCLIFCRGLMPEDDLIYDLAEFFKVFADSTRMKIIDALMENELCVCDIAAIVGTTQSAISHQLRILKQAKLVKYKKIGKIVYYSLDDDHISQIVKKGREHIEEL